MKRTITILSVLLVAQLGVTAGLWLGRGDARATGPDTLVAVKPEAVKHISVTNADGQTLELAGSGSGWALPGADGFPAHGQSVENLIADITGLEAGIPVTRSESALSRFHLGEEGFERRVTLTTGDGEKIALLFGESAGAGRVYARRADSDVVYEVPFQLWQASTDPADWYDTGTLTVDAAKVQKAVLPEFTLERANNGWRLADAEEGATPLDAGKAAGLVTDLAAPSFESVSKAEAEPEGEPLFSYELVTKDDKTVRFRYYAGDDGSAVLVREGQPWRYTVSSEQLATLEETSVDGLLAASGEASGNTAAADTARDGESGTQS